VPADERRAPCLSDDEVLELAALGHALHVEAGCAQDIEWAIDARLEAPENLFLLQRRPETVHSQRQKNLVVEGAGLTAWIATTITKGREIEL
jgi:pyruvate,water dikinase